MREAEPPRGRHRSMMILDALARRSRGRVVSVVPATLLFVSVAFAGAAAQDQTRFAVDPNAPVDDEIGMAVPAGFRAEVFADEVGRARHIAVRDNGDVYVALRERNEGGGTAALRDEDGDGRADTIEYFCDVAETGTAIYDGYLYRSSDTEIVRYALTDDGLVPEGDAEVVVAGFPDQTSHASKAFTLDEQSNLYVNIGAPANACQEQTRTPGSPGMEPCPLLEEHAGIWRFSADETGQSVEDGERFVTGVRNVVALAWNATTDALYFVQHGRDQLHDLWPDLYTVEESAELPAEEFHLAREGANYGWPYTYWDNRRGARMVAPEYGGDGETPAEQGRYERPLATFPGHWAPNGLLFYTGDAFPEAFHGGAFIAFHGSWNRAPLPQRGYNVVFLPFVDGQPAEDWYVFADGFKGREVLESSSDARFRPMGLAQGPDGALYIADSVQGRIWRVTPDESAG
jgi:glucose/arabinose dehydrogenase